MQSTPMIRCFSKSALITCRLSISKQNDLQGLIKQSNPMKTTFILTSVPERILAETITFSIEFTLLAAYLGFNDAETCPDAAMKLKYCQLFTNEVLVSTQPLTQASDE
ncbi:hypothetical protein Q3G72_024757 [Acer saccharum]|nr:hypothetical protein Q3G72_024757 [Acer saccharum]